MLRLLVYWRWWWGGVRGIPLWLMGLGLWGTSSLAPGTAVIPAVPENFICCHTVQRTTPAGHPGFLTHMMCVCVNAHLKKANQNNKNNNSNHHNYIDNDNQVYCSWRCSCASNTNNPTVHNISEWPHSHCNYLLACEVKAQVNDRLLTFLTIITKKR